MTTTDSTPEFPFAPPPPPADGYPAHPYPQHAAYDVAPTTPAARPSRGRRIRLGVGAVITAAAVLVAGIEIGSATSTTSGTGTVAQQLPGSSSGTGSASDANDAQSSGTAATSTQQTGIVTIVSTLTYESAASAGTGMVLTADGEILTNNHVVEGATSITVTVESTGATYRADVVGTDPTDDVAVLQLRNASGLKTAKVGSSSDIASLSDGDAVTGVGNAGGTGTLTAARGRVTALDQSITASDEDGSNAERLTGLIETDADIVSGDSGGPLYDSDGTIVGIDTAGSSSNGAQTAADTTTQAYAIPITTALKIADRIESGTETSTIHIGLPAFLGVAVSPSAVGGAGISSVVSGGAADEAGITAGSVITAIDGKPVASATSLSNRLAGFEPGDKISLTWTDASGASHTATVTLGSGPAD